MLYCQSWGSGPDLVLLHGWGMHGGVWDDTVEAFIDDWRVTVIDLPGHGRSGGRPGTLAGLAAAVAAVAPARAAWLGWSMGGLVAQRIALDAPARVDRLLLTGSNACFVQRPDWPCAMTTAALAKFASGLAEDPKATLERFIALETLNLPNARAHLRVLREIVFRHGLPATAALEDGLAILAAADLRAEWPRLGCPVRLLLGQRDALVPVAAGEALAGLAPDVRVQVFRHATHAPFLSHPDEFHAALATALHD